MTADLPDTGRCPKCGAAVRFGDPWCTLCYADLRPPPPPPPAAPDPDPDPEPAPPFPQAAGEPPAYQRSPLSGPDPLTAPIDVVTSPVAGPSWPCSACGTVNPMADDVCSTCGRHFLADARDNAPLLELPVIGDITRLSRGHRVAIAIGAVFAIVILTVLLGLIFG